MGIEGLTTMMPRDSKGNPIDCVDAHVNISGNVTAQSIFTGRGVISHITIWTDVDAGSITVSDNDGTALFPSAKTDYAGTFHIKRYVTNGMKITTSGFAAGTLTVFYRI